MGGMSFDNRPEKHEAVDTGEASPEFQEDDVSPDDRDAGLPEGRAGTTSEVSNDAKGLWASDGARDGVARQLDSRALETPAMEREGPSPGTVGDSEGHSGAADGGDDPNSLHRSANVEIDRATEQRRIRDEGGG